MRIKSKNQINYRSVFNIYLLSIILITIAIAPNFASDPFNILKASILLASSIFLSLLLIFVISIKNIFFQNKELILLVLFPINLIIVAMLTSSSKIQQIYGVFGRRTGLLTYLSFFLFFLITVAFGKYLKLNRIISSFFILGFVNAIYSLLQPLGLFRIENLASKNVQPFGFFGNTNFQSAFLGFTLILSFANFGINISKKSYYKFVINMARLIIIFSLYKSDSQQGFIIFLSGIYIFCVVYFFISQNHLKFILALVFGLFSFTLFALGLFNLGLSNLTQFMGLD